MEDSTGNGNSQNNVHRAAILLIRALEVSYNIPSINRINPTRGKKKTTRK